jgi:DNA mismatch repair protein MutL
VGAGREPSLPVEGRIPSSAARGPSPANGETPAGAGEPATAAVAEAGAPPQAFSGPAWRFLGIAHGNYALFETAAGIVVLDRRAAYERVWCERLQRGAGAKASQRLLAPTALALDPVAAALLVECLELLQGNGFSVAEFGPRFFRIESIPDWMEPAEAERFLRDFLGAVREGRPGGGRADFGREELARLAAARSLRLQSAGEAEAKALLAELFATPYPLTSPRGRPTIVELAHAELNRRFQKG